MVVVVARSVSRRAWLGKEGLREESSRCLKSKESLRQRFPADRKFGQYRADLISDGRLGLIVDCLCLQFYL